MEAYLVIIGAGAAGIGAAKAARRLGIDAVVLKASHRIGGRA
jgi:cation diffusion facilitator CzcD-associated flavoprotein CzcO